MFGGMAAAISAVLPTVVLVAYAEVRRAALGRLLWHCRYQRSDHYLGGCRSRIS
jgi:hypothetical protein